MADPHDPEHHALPGTWADSERFVPRTFVRPALAFMRLEASGGVVMLVAALVAVLWANSVFGDSYFDLFGATVEISFGGFEFHHLSELTIQEWVNDAAMVIFFFAVGLEIKRELVEGDLRDPRAAALPVIAALGGMIVPAAIYLAFNAGTPQARGWGIPMATDIAFAVGVVTMLGRRVPVGGKLFLLALAIADDLGAIIVIAIFYTAELSLGWLLAAVGGLVVVVMLTRAGVRGLPVYLLAGTFVWLAMLESGVHATIAGVALAMACPSKSLYSPRRFGDRARALIDRAEASLPDDDTHALELHSVERVESTLADMKRLAAETLSPLDRNIIALSPWVSYLIVPVFALANAGVVLGADSIAGLTGNAVTLGVMLGLVVGKTLGIFGASVLAVKVGLGVLPRSVNWRHMLGLAATSGVGFTVALFVASLAFEDPAPGSAAKVGIFAGSLIAGLIGYAILRWWAPNRSQLDDAPADGEVAPGRV